MSEQPDIAQLKAQLLARQSELNELLDISSDSRNAVELDQTSVGRVSRIDAIQKQQMALASERQRRDELTRINAALERISEGTYGECLSCGEPIAVRRLTANPAVAICIDCASGRDR